MGKITKELLERTLSKKRDDLLPVFCVIRECVGCVIPGFGTYTHWMAVTEPENRCCTELSRAQAKALIAIYKMEPVIDEPDCTIYDNYDGAYRERYKGHKVNI